LVWFVDINLFAGAYISDPDDEVDLESDISSALLKQKQRSVRGLSMKILARENLVKQISMRNVFDDLESNDLHSANSSSVSEATVNMTAMEGKLQQALAATSSAVEKSLVATGKIEAGVAARAANALGLLAEVVPGAVDRVGSLHKLADDVGFLLLSGEDDCEVLMEIVLEAMDCWLDGYQGQAVEMLKLSEEYCEFPSEAAFVRGLQKKLGEIGSLSPTANAEISEIIDKFNSMLSIHDTLNDLQSSYDEMVELQEQHQEDNATQLTAASRKSPGLIKETARSSRTSSRRSSNRGPTPEQMDALKLSLQDNRLQRLKDRENAQDITANMKQNVADAIATALNAAAMESVDVGVQTDGEPDAVETRSMTDDVAVEEENYRPMMSTRSEGKVEQELEVVSAAPTFSTVMAALPPGEYYRLFKIVFRHFISNLVLRLSACSSE
jgi:hypothetical protein